MQIKKSNVKNGRWCEQDPPSIILEPVLDVHQHPMTKCDFLYRHSPSSIHVLYQIRIAESVLQIYTKYQHCFIT